MKSLAVSVVYMAIHWPTPGFKGRTFQLCVLIRWDFNFSDRSSPLRDIDGKTTKYANAFDTVRLRLIISACVFCNFVIVWHLLMSTAARFFSVVSSSPAAIRLFSYCTRPAKNIGQTTTVPMNRVANGLLETAEDICQNRAELLTFKTHGTRPVKTITVKTLLHCFSGTPTRKLGTAETYVS